MSWQPPTTPPQRPSESSRAVAWTALFFSLVATALAGFVFLKSYEGGRFGEKLKKNIDTLRDETARVLATKKEAGGGASGDGTDMDPDPDDAVPEGAQRDTARWDGLRAKVGDIQDMIEKGDERAGEMLHELKGDFRAMREYGSEKTAAAIDTLVEKTEEARASLATDAEAARSSLSEVRDGLAEQIKTAAPKKGKSARVEEAEAEAAEQGEPADGAELPDPPAGEATDAEN